MPAVEVVGYPKGVSGQGTGMLTKSKPENLEYNKSHFCSQLQINAMPSACRFISCSVLYNPSHSKGVISWDGTLTKINDSLVLAHQMVTVAQWIRHFPIVNNESLLEWMEPFCLSHTPTVNSVGHLWYCTGKDDRNMEEVGTK